MKYLILLMIVIMFTNCNKEESKLNKTFIESSFELSFRNKNGEDLLDSNTIGCFNHDKIEIFIIENGIKKILNNNSNSNFFSKERGYYTILVHATGDSTFLQLSESIIDTITTEWKSGSNYYHNTKMWYNGELKWEQDKTEFPILITK